MTKVEMLSAFGEESTSMTCAEMLSDRSVEVTSINYLVATLVNSKVTWYSISDSGISVI